MTPQEQFEKDVRKRKQIYFFVTLTILTVILFILSIWLNFKIKWYIYFIVFFSSRGIANFLTNKYYTVDRAFDYILPDEDLKIEDEEKSDMQKGFDAIDEIMNEHKNQ